MLNVSTDLRVRKILYSFSRIDRTRIDKIINLFKDQGFLLDERYLKKLSKNIWELRPGKVRLLFGIVDNEVIIVNIFIKKTMKTPSREIKLAERRLAEYL